MAYKTEELIEKSLEIIKSKNIHFIEDLVSYLPCDKKTFYNHNLHEFHLIKEAIEQNKLNIKNNLRKKWYDSDNATTQIALYKLLASQAELKALTNQTISGDSENPINLSEIKIKIV